MRELFAAQAPQNAFQDSGQVSLLHNYGEALPVNSTGDWGQALLDADRQAQQLWRLILTAQAGTTNFEDSVEEGMAGRDDVRQKIESLSASK